jgi:hypothetical protein
MRKIIAFGTAGLLAVIAVATWATARTHPNDHARASAAFGNPIMPFDLMTHSKGLPHQQYDAH